jgi:aminoglycoside 3-N-acetyltransferase
MGELEVISNTTTPATVATLTADLRTLGLVAGDIVIVHSSLSKLGWIAGGAQAVVDALRAAVAPNGTIVMPTQSGQLTDPARWSHPPVPPEWIDTIRNETPAFDPATTPTRDMGQIVDCFRSYPGTVRNGHPSTSFAANGPMAATILGELQLTPALGDGSPIHRLYQHDAKVLMLGVDHGNNTSLHLAEHRATWPTKHTFTERAPIMRDGVRHLAIYEELDYDDSDFSELGEAFHATGQGNVGPVGAGTARLANIPAMVDFAVGWIETNRAG